MNNLNILVNNAGVFNKEYLKTIDNLEMTFSVNVISPFILNMECIKNIKSLNKIINTSSISYLDSEEHLINLDLNKL